MDKLSVITLDPESKLLFRYNLESNEFTPETRYIDIEKNKVEEEIRNFETLRGFESTDWTFLSEECENYRRRAIWPYLLQPDCGEYPAFISSRELSSAFADEIDIRLSVDVSSYINAGSDDSDEDLKTEEKESIQYNKAEKIVHFKVSLVFSANEAIKLMKKQVFKDFALSLKPRKPHHQLVFKVKGRKEYLTGNYPLLAYRYVRELLRGVEIFKLTLKEIPKTQEHLFPQFVNDFEPLPHIENFLMFYGPPTKPSKKPQVLSQKPRIFLLHSQKPSKERRVLTESLLKGSSPPNIGFSGECEWPFRLKICGVDGLFNLFSEGIQGSATNNGKDHPAYVVLPKSKAKESKHGKPQQRSDSTIDRKSSSTISKFRPRTASTKGLSYTGLYSNFMNHGATGTLSQELANEFKLPFPPYWMRFDVMLLYGEDVVENCCKSTRNYPFNFNARAMEWVTFPIKVSNLPKETRVGINVYAISKQGDSFLLGSVVKPVFNEYGSCITGKTSLNLWPFYKVEQRIGCMQEFWGKNSGYTERSDSDPLIPSQNYLEYAKIYLEFDSYSMEKFTWSLKDDNYYRSQYKLLSTPYRTSALTVKPKNTLQVHHRVQMSSKIQFSSTFHSDSLDEEDQKLLKCKPQVDDLANLEKALLTDPLDSLSPVQKKLLFMCRDHYKTIPLSLPLFLRSVDWTRPLQVLEASRYLDCWSKMQPEDNLALLNANYPDENIRLYACRRISQISDDDLVLYMPQLTQALSFEVHHFSSLGELLIERSLKSPHYVGHALFWALRSQLFVKATAERFGLILEQFLMLCGGYRKQLLSEVRFVELISNLGALITVKDGYQEKGKYLRASILEGPSRLLEVCTLPVDSSMEVTDLCVEECKVMDSKKMPIWVTMQNSERDCEHLRLIFKSGDDLRQDILTLQMIRAMDNIWLENGLDLRMKPYRVVATGDQAGVIEVVSDSETTSDIQKNYGGTLGALKKNTLRDFLEEHNPDKAQMQKALDNFIKSCAGYCVATYILGIADRHNGNIMMTKTGHLFHIDFGHFLGNFKTKFGIQRERSSFVFTEEMAYAMGGKKGEGFQVYKDCCCKAYNFVRKHGKRLINLFMLMTSAGLQELQNKEEIVYIRDMLSLKLTETEAEGKFNTEIEMALNNTFRRIDNLIHNMRRNRSLK